MRQLFIAMAVLIGLSIPLLAQTTGPTTRRTYDAPPPMTIDVNKKYLATIDTDRGQIVCELYPKDAPKTVNSFKFLADHHFYDGLDFHRVVPGFVVQGGDPNGDGTGGPGYTVPLEVDGAEHKHDIGALAMARTADPDSAGSQFYITLAPQPDLDGKYTVFGQVIKGQDVVRQIQINDRIKSITVKAE